MKNNQPCKNFCNLRRQHLLWKLHKNQNPSFFEEVIPIGNQEAGLRTKDKISSVRNNTKPNMFNFFLWKMDVVNFYSIDFTEISEEFTFTLK